MVAVYTEHYGVQTEKSGWQIIILDYSELLTALIVKNSLIIIKWKV